DEGGGDVGRAARSERHDELDDLGGIVLGVDAAGVAGDERQRDHADPRECSAVSHGGPPWYRSSPIAGSVSSRRATDNRGAPGPAGDPRGVSIGPGSNSFATRHPG